MPTDAPHHGRLVMSVLHRPRHGTLLLALVLIVVSTGTAAARQDGKRAQQRPAPALSVDAPAAAAARYFTIDQVLAKREAQRASNPSVQFASTSATMTDAPLPGRSLLPSAEPFGLSTFRAPEGLLWVKWRGVGEQMRAEATELAACRADRAVCSSQALHFLRLVESAQARDGRARIDRKSVV